MLVCVGSRGPGGGDDLPPLLQPRRPGSRQRCNQDVVCRVSLPRSATRGDGDAVLATETRRKQEHNLQFL